MTHRLLLVHAHPDDETINSGATMARCAAEGVSVTLVTCTRGEQGEVIPRSLAHLEGSGDGLGDHRVGELSAAMKALGVADHRFLGQMTTAPGGTAKSTLAEGGQVFRDSGMAYDVTGGVIPSPTPIPGAFALTPVETAAAVLASVLLEVRPHVVLGYEPGGGYGHPDHVQAHLVMMRAVELAAVDGWSVPKVYWSALPESLVRAALEMMSVSGTPGLDPGGRLPSMVMPDSAVTTVIDASEYLPAKLAALRAHATQVTVTPDDTFFALSNGIHQPVIGLEFYRLVRGDLSGPRDDLNRETTLFANLTP